MEVSTPDSTALAVDYPGPHARTQLKQLNLEKLGLPVRYPLREVLPRVLDATEYAAALYRGCGLAEVDVPMLLGYCAAGEIARELAAMCSAAGGQPRLVLINPERAADYDLVRTIEAVLRQPLPVPAVEPLSPERLTLATFEDLERDLAEAFIAKLGDTDGSVARDLSRMQTDWAIHLIAASRPALAPTAAELHIVSPDHTCPGRCPATHLTVDATVDNICAVPAVAEAVQAEWLEQSPPGPESALRCRSQGEGRCLQR